MSFAVCNCRSISFLNEHTQQLCLRQKLNLQPLSGCVFICPSGHLLLKYALYQKVNHSNNFFVSHSIFVIFDEQCYLGLTNFDNYNITVLIDSFWRLTRGLSHVTLVLLLVILWTRMKKNVPQLYFLSIRLLLLMKIYFSKPYIMRQSDMCFKETRMTCSELSGVLSF